MTSYFNSLLPSLSYIIIVLPPRSSYFKELCLETIKLSIDGRDIEAPKGKSVLEAALEAGIYIPYLCYHPDLGTTGECGLCVVEVAGRDDLVLSCTEPVAAGLTIQTKTSKIALARRQAMEKILKGHPADCGTCNKYLNCELQSLKQYVSEEEYKPRGPARLFAVDDSNPLFTINPNKCVMCTRCVRACKDLRGVGILVEKTRGDEKYIGTENDLSLAESGCRFCGACAEVCPSGAILDKEELTRGKNRKTALLPCRYTCPAEIDVPRYLRFIGDKDYAAAAAVIREKVPFPVVLGYVCDHPCEGVCRRGQVNQSIAIRELKRFAAEKAEDALPKINKKPSTDKKVAVIGAGPAGLTAAYYLSLKGHTVTVFDALPSAGGMLRYGIPEYRLPRQVLDKEIKYIQDAGVEIKTGTRIESIARLFEEGYHGVVTAVGTQRGQKLPIPGADNDGVLIGVDFLRSINSGEKVSIGKNVLVLGGGNVAFDCARAARRLGAAQVKMACLESREMMPAAEDEIKQGEEEGITLYPARTFTRVLSENGKITGVECFEVTSLTFDEEKRPQIEVKENSAHVLDADTVIFAIGQRPEIPEGFGLNTIAGNLIEVDAFTFTTNLEGVFASGDAVNGTSSVIKAIASGRKAAIELDKYLGGDGNIDEKLAPEIELNANLGRRDDFAALVRCAENLVTPEERLKGFGRVVADLDENVVECEAKRCLQCDLRLKITPIKFWGNY
jgi:NADPH-dependent glutamate synthase beta subunit-like oxidoreductase/ferredoxin/Pyruvate/2-oxoacid:ferredoxin oxidoreductase delta subunit